MPQPLTYLIADVHRRHGTLVVLPALSCVRSDDESLLIEVAAHRGLRSLRPHLLAPTVLAVQGPAAAVLQALRAAGYMPVPADEHGVVTLGRSSSALRVDGPDGGLSQPGGFDDPDQPDPPMVERLRDLGSPASGDRDALFDSGLLEFAAALLSTAKPAVIGGRSRGIRPRPPDDRSLRRGPRHRSSSVS